HHPNLSTIRSFPPRRSSDLAPSPRWSARTPSAHSASLCHSSHKLCSGGFRATTAHLGWQSPRLLGLYMEKYVGNHCNYCRNRTTDRKSTRLNSSHGSISYAV